MRPRSSTRAPKNRRYVSTASSRSATAKATWCRERTSTLRSYPRGPTLVIGELDHAADGFAGVRLRLDACQQLLELRPHERLLLEQRVGELVERPAVFGEEAERLREGVVTQPRLLLVAEALRVLRERVVVRAHRPRRDALAHPELEHHRAGELRDALEVVGGPVRHGAEDDLLGGAARQEDLHQIEQLFLRVQVSVFLGRVERVAERTAARDDGHLLHRLRAADEVRHERVATLVVSEDALLLLRDDAPLLEAGEVRRRDDDLAVEAARAEKGRVEVLEPVRGPDDHHAVRTAEAVELDEKLVQRLVVLTVEARACAPRAYGVELVDEDDRRGVLARLLEKLADARGPESREHLHERRCALRVEVGTRGVGNRFREQRLAGAGRPVEEDSLRHARPETREAAWV